MSRQSRPDVCKECLAPWPQSMRTRISWQAGLSQLSTAPSAPPVPPPGPADAAPAALGGWLHHEPPSPCNTGAKPVGSSSSALKQWWEIPSSSCRLAASRASTSPAVRHSQRSSSVGGISRAALAGWLHPEPPQPTCITVTGAATSAAAMGAAAAAAALWVGAGRGGRVTPQLARVVPQHSRPNPVMHCPQE